MKKIIIISLLILYSTSFAQWYTQNSGTTKALWGFHFFNSGTGIVFGDNGTILRTSNAGLNWISYPSGINENFTFMNFINDNTGYIISYHNLLKTTNKGINWTTTYFSGSDGFTSVAFFDNNTGYLFGYQCNNSYKTTNGGLNWSKLCMTPPQYGYSVYYCSKKINDTLVLVGGAVGQQHFEPGASFFWARRSDISTGSPGSPGSLIGKIVMAGNSGVGYAWRSGWLLKTTDFGNTWANAPYYLGGSMSFYNDSIGLYIGSRTTNYFYFAYSKDRGNQWIIRDSVLTHNYLYYGEIISPNVALAVGDSGKILRNNNFTIGIKNLSEIIPDRFLLLQNYPNPFNPTTIIRFQIKDSRFVTLKVYDILGKEVATLVNEKQLPGVYEVTWDASQFPSGIYFYKFTAGDFSEVKNVDDKIAGAILSEIRRGGVLIK